MMPWFPEIMGGSFFILIVLVALVVLRWK